MNSDHIARPNYDPPYGMEPYDMRKENDLGALNDEQQSKLNELKKQTRIHNEAFLRSHPEVEVLISGFISETLHKRPKNVREFASDYFTDTNLPSKVLRDLETREKSKQLHEEVRKLPQSMIVPLRNKSEENLD